MIRLFDEIEPPHYLDRDEPVRMWCRYCKTNVLTVKCDQGIGRYEYQGAKGVHIDMRDTCAVCGYEDLEGARAETELEEDHV